MHKTSRSMRDRGRAGDGSRVRVSPVPRLVILEVMARTADLGDCERCGSPDLVTLYTSGMFGEVKPTVTACFSCEKARILWE